MGNIFKLSTALHLISVIGLVAACTLPEIRYSAWTVLILLLSLLHFICFVENLIYIVYQINAKTDFDVETKIDIGTEHILDAANYASSPILEERQFWNPNANDGQGGEETHLVPKGKPYPQMKITPDIEDALVKAAQESLDNMGTPVWDNIRIRGEWIDFMQGSHLALSIPKKSLEAALNAPRKLSMDVVADSSIPPNEALMVNTETGEVLGTITNIKLEDK